MSTIIQIKQQIMNHPANEHYTQKGIEPLFKASPKAKLVVVGQAPGKQAQESQMVWNDKSGDRLREWMGVNRQQFYMSDKIAHLPMDFYYPGKAKTGDQPPRSNFASQWHPKLLETMPKVQTIILAGSYAQKFYLKDSMKRNLTETVKHYQDYLPHYFPLVHPSPLNFRWHRRNPWFNEEVVPHFRSLVQEILKDV